MRALDLAARGAWLGHAGRGLEPAASELLLRRQVFAAPLRRASSSAPFGMSARRRDGDNPFALDARREQTPRLVGDATRRPDRPPGQEGSAMLAIDPSTRRTSSRVKAAALAGFLAAALAGCGAAATGAPLPSSASVAPRASLATAAPSAAATSAPTTLVIASPSATAAPTTPVIATSVPSAKPIAGGGTAAAWCGFVIDVNTKYGYMTNKNYSATPPSMEVQRQILTEALSRLDEWVAKTPPEIKEATAAEVAYFLRLKAYGDAHGWANPAGFPQPTAAEAALIGSLVPYQKKECGITFGK
jgi:hypothetical protein